MVSEFNNLNETQYDKGSSINDVTPEGEGGLPKGDER